MTNILIKVLKKYNYHRWKKFRMIEEKYYIHIFWGLMCASGLSMSINNISFLLWQISWLKYWMITIIEGKSLTWLKKHIIFVFSEACASGLDWFKTSIAMKISKVSIGSRYGLASIWRQIKYVSLGLNE